MPLLRRARPDDLADLLELTREFNAVDGHDHDDARVAHALGPLLEGDEHGQVWLIEKAVGIGEAVEIEEAEGAPAAAGAGPLGYAVVCWGYSLESGGREALIDEFYVRDRGRGVGSAAMHELLDACRAAGALGVFLETEAPNESARRFYRRHGFQDEPSIWMSRGL
ncbi:N-acetyltransferase [Frankia sp. CNm7]|uniref:N-acetyltransferase n=1 Tax=Frankia nepalensis TaxID=1836974 RepID=A0A937UL03_9ACTN|nr:GNAT family N-acetyltransferase [Frankia nepalensis]MBL7496371.1 N-acetyltransferase [Frankia nepalensis]MBL7511479.1 N-acetyltransferase [Frankia nepalensis]MBL7521980.1 N-acetyltransferase [Frankia nepalensis]MBL7627344.1 N-acetyltransferase [Frankia nepalensis]